MKYYSTKNKHLTADFKEATIKGQPEDKGLYFPEMIPTFSESFIHNIVRYSKEEIAYEVIKPYVGDIIPVNELKQIVSETINFSFPLVKINDKVSSLELFHGPTLAFKDVGARFMSRCLSWFLSDSKKEVTVLVATSGDTGGAVANGFYNVEGVKVIILYPSGKVSDIQEKQLTTLGNNITALEIDGVFDDCQQMVKEAFADKELNNVRYLTSANSINVARWLPQQFYYLFAYQQWKDKNHPPVLSIPSGNFGNICAGLLAYASGLPVKHFIAACNANDVVPNFLETGEFNPKDSISTLSNAMDVGNPSNFIRIMEIFDHQFEVIKSKISAYSINDKDTVNTIKEIYSKYNYLLDPHGAVAYKALEHYLRNHQEDKGIILETAHPYKFQNIIGLEENEWNLPISIKHLKDQKKSSIKMQPDFNELKAYLMERHP
jgi:threonine synthase